MQDHGIKAARIIHCAKVPRTQIRTESLNVSNFFVQAGHYLLHFAAKSHMKLLLKEVTRASRCLLFVCGSLLRVLVSMCIVWPHC